jgi:predicted DNA-binding antitoxin AbrB/MazE fold protein
MIKEIEAIYERGIIRLVEPLGLPEGSRLNAIVISQEKSRSNGNAAEILAEMAAMPLEGASDSFSGREHDSVLPEIAGITSLTPALGSPR